MQNEATKTTKTGTEKQKHGRGVEFRELGTLRKCWSLMIEGTAGFFSFARKTGFLDELKMIKKNLDLFGQNHFHLNAIKTGQKNLIGRGLHRNYLLIIFGIKLKFTNITSTNLDLCEYLDSKMENIFWGNLMFQRQEKDKNYEFIIY